MERRMFLQLSLVMGGPSSLEEYTASDSHSPAPQGQRSRPSTNSS
jgi:hypothetical protein